MAKYLGFDSGTQSLKAMIIDTATGRVEALETVNFGRDLPEFDSPEGVLSDGDPLVKHADPMMWLAALDMVLARLRDGGAPLAEIAGIGGSGQQHGSVYLNSRFPAVLADLKREKDLAEQLKPALSRRTSPIWMDGSTAARCAEISAAIGPRLRTDTGSPAIERFTGPQIRKFSHDDPAGYAETAFIHLVSSFMASVLCGKSAPVDYGDGAGMNLLNLKTLEWDAEIAAATAPGLIDKLPPPSPANTIAGELSAYFAKYGLPPGTPVSVWSGDNPCSLIGTGAAAAGTAVISLGTSITFFAAMRGPLTDPDGYGHVFGNPAGGFMSLICFKNGTLALEEIKKKFDLEWSYIDGEALELIPPGNDGDMMLPYFIDEITPLVPRAGVVYSGSGEFEAGLAAPERYIRAVVEAQAMSLRSHSAWIGDDFSSIIVTGGGAKSRGVAQVLADVFNTSVERIGVSDSAALGAAMIAANAVNGEAWNELSAGFAASRPVANPDPESAAVYARMLPEYQKLETLAAI